MDSVILDSGAVEEHPVVDASLWGVGPQRLPIGAAQRDGIRDRDRFRAAMVMHPRGHVDAVAVAKSVDHSGEPRQVAAPSRETIMPPPTARRHSDHLCACPGVLRPVLHKHAQSNKTAAMVVSCHQFWKR